MSGNEQYSQHDWSSITWAALLLAAAVVVVLALAAFLVMAARPVRPRPRRAVVRRARPAAPADTPPWYESDHVRRGRRRPDRSRAAPG
jgi:hypothetical protein